jgi:hypothetical protein
MPGRRNHVHFPSFLFTLRGVAVELELTYWTSHSVLDILNTSTNLDTHGEMPKHFACPAQPGGDCRVGSCTWNVLMREQSMLAQ